MSLWPKKVPRLPKRRLRRHRPAPPQELQSALPALPSEVGRPHWWWLGTRRRAVGIVLSAASIWLLGLAFGVFPLAPAGNRELHLFFSLPRDASTPLADALRTGKVFMALEVASEADTLPPEPFASLLNTDTYRPLRGQFVQLYVSFWQDRDFKVPARFDSPTERLLTLDLQTDQALDVADTNARRPFTPVVAQPAQKNFYVYRMTTSSEPLSKLGAARTFNRQTGWYEGHIARFLLTLQRPLKAGKGLAQLEVRQIVQLHRDDFKGLRVRLGNELQYDRGFEDVRLLVGVDDEGAPGRIGSTATSGYRKAVVERSFDGTEVFGGIAVLSAFGTHAARKDLLDFLLIALGAIFGVAVTWVLDPVSGRRYPRNGVAKSSA
jgi:hypothetical protein